MSQYVGKIERHGVLAHLAAAFKPIAKIRGYSDSQDTFGGDGK
jgi:hypothetical protein